jgi:RluA family pseudouridine synthase
MSVISVSQAINPDWILWQDDHLLVVNKPAGLSTLVDGYHPDAPYLYGLLKQLVQPLWVVHRLDKATSGVIVFARTAAAHRSLNLQFDSRQVEKKYHALVWGEPEWEERTVDLPLRANGDRRHRSVVDHQNGKSAQTTFFVLDRYPGITLIRAQPHTGRTHQIRAHLAALALPIVGDGLYGGASLSDFDRMGLHAFSLEFTHTNTGEKMKFEAAYPLEYERILENLNLRRLNPAVRTAE